MARVPPVPDTIAYFCQEESPLWRDWAAWAAQHRLNLRDPRPEAHWVLADLADLARTDGWPRAALYHRHLATLATRRLTLVGAAAQVWRDSKNGPSSARRYDVMAGLIQAGRRGEDPLGLGPVWSDGHTVLPLRPDDLEKLRGHHPRDRNVARAGIAQLAAYLEVVGDDPQPLADPVLTRAKLRLGRLEKITEFERSELRLNQLQNTAVLTWSVGPGDNRVSVDLSRLRLADRQVRRVHPDVRMQVGSAGVRIVWCAGGRTVGLMLGSLFGSVLH